MDVTVQFMQGGEEGLRAVMQAFSVPLMKYAYSILLNHHDAEDVVQDVFVSAFKFRTRFDGKNLSAWLYKITYNQCMNKRKRHLPLFWHDVKTEPSTWDNVCDDSALHALLKPLKPSERAILYERIFLGHSYDELSAISGKSVTSLRKQYERAKKKITKILSECNDFCMAKGDFV